LYKLVHKAHRNNNGFTRFRINTINC